MKDNLGNNYKIHPDDYSKFIQNIDFRDIYLISANVVNKSKTEAIKEEVKIEIKDIAKYSITKDNSVLVEHKYSLNGFSFKKNKKILFIITVTFALVLKTSIEFNDDYFSIFKNLNLPINTWPYFREYVQNTIGRFNLPPLILPPLKKV